jgi:hypothetical protein
MEPRKVGRTLGIGVRVASNMVRQRVEEARQSSQATSAANQGEPTTNRPVPEAQPIPVAPRVAAQAANARRGVRAFGQALVTPFTHAGGILWLEITGLFFALFAVFFAQGIYRLRGALHGAQPGDMQHLALYVFLTLGFAWFSVSSFLRARRKTKQGPGWRK